VRNSLKGTLCSIDRDFGERALKVKILRLVMAMGVIASIIGVIVNTALGYPVYSIVIHIIGAVLLISLFLMIDNKLSLEKVSIIVFSYYCFIYTPLGWFYEGVFGSVPFVSFMIGTFIIVLLNNRSKKFFLISYNILLIVLAGIEMASVYNKGEIDKVNKLFIHNLSYFIMYFILVYALTIFKALYDRHSEDLKILSINDVLTGVYNRGYMSKLLEFFLERYNDNQEVFSLILCDLDGFKAINDSYGHDVGDKCLISFANFMKESLGEKGIIGRIGGDEFIAIVPGKNKEETEALAEELCNKLEELEIVDIGRKLKMSIGISDVLENNNMKKMIKLADERMYNSKKMKRNRSGFHGTN